jgi:perosamine synthetase
MRFLGYGHQTIDRSDIDAVVAALESDLLTQGPQVERFEAALAERVGARHAVAVSSGTAGLHLACLAAGIEPGDRGLTSAITFSASANCLIYAGADAGFVDIDLNSIAISPDALAQALNKTPSVRAIVPVHMAGLAEGMADIRKIAGNRIVIEDAAHAFGGAYECGGAVGSCAYSEMAVFSFHPVKQITTGEGGAVLTNDAELARRLRLLRTHGIEQEPGRFVSGESEEDGQTKPWFREQQMLGLNYRITEMQAALGLSQLKKLDRFLDRRRAIARRYDEVFSKLSAVRLPQSHPEQRQRSAHHLYIVLLDFSALNTTRTQIMRCLAERGIGSQVHYIPVYHHPFHARRVTDRNAFPQAECYYRNCLSLPLHPGLSDEEVERVIGAVTNVVETHH